MAEKFRVQGEIIVVDRASAQVRKVRTAFGELNDFLRRHFAITFGDIQRVVRQAFEAISEAIDLSRQTTALKLQLGQAGIAFGTFLSDVERAAQGTISQATAIKLALQGLGAGVPVGALVDAFQAARGEAIAMGTDIETAFGKVIEKLEAATKPAAQVAQELGAAADRADQLAGAASRSADAIDRVTTRLSNWFTRLKEGVAVIGLAIATIATGLPAALAQATEKLVSFAAQIVAVLEKIPGLGLVLGGEGGLSGILHRLAQEIGDFGRTLQGTSSDFAAAALEWGKGGENLVQLDDAARQATVTVVSLGRAQREAKVAAEEHNAVLVQQIQLLQMTSAQFDQVSRAQGRAAATEQALEQGGRLSSAGRRIHLPGGGSRLTPLAISGGGGSTAFAAPTAGERVERDARGNLLGRQTRYRSWMAGGTRI